MGQQTKLENAILFLAVSYQPDIDIGWMKNYLLPQFGIVKEITTPFDFNYSHYYTKEMGENLQKVFLVFENLYDVSKAAQTKIKSNELEQKFAKNSQRTINLDPGYLTLAKLVLTTTKNYDHRIHIASGIYGDIQLRYRQGEFVENPWTYPDYRSSKSIIFFLQARQYLHNLVTKK